MLNGEMRKVEKDFVCGERDGAKFAVEVDKLLNAVQVEFFGSQTVMAQAQGVPHFIQRKP